MRNQICGWPLPYQQHKSLNCRSDFLIFTLRISHICNLIFSYLCNRICFFTQSDLWVVDSPPHICTDWRNSANNMMCLKCAYTAVLYILRDLNQTCTVYTAVCTVLTMLPCHSLPVTFYFTYFQGHILLTLHSGTVPVHSDPAVGIIRKKCIFTKTAILYYTLLSWGP